MFFICFFTEPKKITEDEGKKLQVAKKPISLSKFAYILDLTLILNTHIFPYIPNYGI